MIYFVSQAGGEAPVKIGYTRAPESLAKRVSQIQTGYPWKLELLHTCDGDTRTEAAIHLKLSSHRLHGEWFRRDYVVKNFIRHAISKGVDSALERDFTFTPAKQLFGVRFTVYPQDHTPESIHLATRLLDLLTADCRLSVQDVRRMLKLAVSKKDQSNALRGSLFSFSEDCEMLTKSSNVLPNLHGNGVRNLYLGFSDRQVEVIAQRKKTEEQQLGGLSRVG